MTGLENIYLKSPTKTLTSGTHFSSEFFYKNILSSTCKGYTANIHSQYTVISCVTFPTVIWQWLSQPTAVLMALSGIEEYSLSSIPVLGCNMHSQITVGNVTLPKAVLSTVKIFAMYKENCEDAKNWWIYIQIHSKIEI